MISDWNLYLAQEQDKLDAVAAQVQGMIDDYGMPIARLEELAKIDLSVVDPQLLQQITLKTGIKLEELKSEKPSPNASNFRQRTRALAV
jgi:hypothetical protein